MQKETYPTAISIGETKNGASGETEAMAEGQEKKTDAEREQLEEAFRQKISRELEHSVWSGIKETCRDAGGEALKVGCRTEEKKQRFLELKEGTGKKTPKILETQKQQKAKRRKEIKRKQVTQTKQEIQIKSEKNGTQGKENVYGKADSDQKPAA